MFTLSFCVLCVLYRIVCDVNVCCVTCAKCNVRCVLLVLRVLCVVCDSRCVPRVVRIVVACLRCVESWCVCIRLCGCVWCVL